MLYQVHRNHNSDRSLAMFKKTRGVACITYCRSKIPPPVRYGRLAKTRVQLRDSYTDTVQRRGIGSHRGWPKAVPAHERIWPRHRRIRPTLQNLFLRAADKLTTRGDLCYVYQEDGSVIGCA